MNLLLTLHLNLFQNILSQPHAIPAQQRDRAPTWGFLADPAKLPDEELLVYIQRAAPPKRQEAITILYNRHTSALYGFIRSKVSSQEMAQEILSDVWLVALQKIDDFQWQGAALRTWLMGIAVNKCKEHFRHTKAENGLIRLDDEPVRYEKIVGYLDQALTLDEDGEARPSPTVTFREQANLLLAEALDTLKPVERQVIELIYYKNLNRAQIGKLLKKKAGTIRQTHARARVKIEKYIEQEIKSHGVKTPC